MEIFFISWFILGIIGSIILLIDIRSDVGYLTALDFIIACMIALLGYVTFFASLISRLEKKKFFRKK